MVGVSLTSLKGWLFFWSALMSILLLMPVSCGTTFEVDRSFSGRISLGEGGDIYRIPAERGETIAFSVSVVNGSSVRILFGTEGTSDFPVYNTYIRSYGDPVTEFNASFEEGETGTFVLYIYNLGGDTVYDIAISVKEKPRTDPVIWAITLFVCIAPVVLFGILALLIISKRSKAYRYRYEGGKKKEKKQPNDADLPYRIE